jgi:hypothetical protein
MITVRVESSSRHPNAQLAFVGVHVSADVLRPTDPPQALSVTDGARLLLTPCAHCLCRSGTIDIWELKQVLEAMGQKPTEEELFQMISEVDENMSGTIGAWRPLCKRGRGGGGTPAAGVLPNLGLLAGSTSPSPRARHPRFTPLAPPRPAQTSASS